MSEHRVRPARHKGVLNFQQELTQALYAFGDDKNPLPETLRVLDEIVTDYIIETVHTASKAATVAGRGKVKAEDFKFAIRKDELATGRVKELLAMEKALKDARQQFDTEEGRVGLERGTAGPGRGRRKKNQTPGVDGAADEPKGAARRKSDGLAGGHEDGEEDVDEDMD